MMNKNQKRNNKNNVKKLALLGLIGTLTVGSIGAMSYFTDRQSMRNDFTTGVLDLEESETYWDTSKAGPDGQVDGHNTYPGYTRLKNPSIQNVSGIEDNDAWVKATVTFIDAKTGKQITDQRRNELIYQTLRYDAGNVLVENTATAGGYTEEQLDKYPNINPAFKDMTATKGSTTGGKYVYYLKDTLKSAKTAAGGEKVTLFTTIAYPTDWSQTELDIMGDYYIEIVFSGIQSWTFPNVDTAMDSLDAEDAAGTLHENYVRVTPGNKDATPNEN